MPNDNGVAEMPIQTELAKEGVGVITKVMTEKGIGALFAILILIGAWHFANYVFPETMKEFGRAHKESVQTIVDTFKEEQKGSREVTRELSADLKGLRATIEKDQIERTAERRARTQFGESKHGGSGQ